MNIGDLRDRVLIREKTVTYDAEKAAKPTYSDGTRIWAQMTPVGGEIAERRFGVSESNITVKMKTRRTSIVVMGNRVEFDGSTYEIRHVAKYPDCFISLLRAL